MSSFVQSILCGVQSEEQPATHQFYLWFLSGTGLLLLSVEEDSVPKLRWTYFVFSHKCIAWQVNSIVVFTNGNVFYKRRLLYSCYLSISRPYNQTLLVFLTMYGCAICQLCIAEKNTRLLAHSSKDRTFCDHMHYGDNYVDVFAPRHHPPHHFLCRHRTRQKNAQQHLWGTNTNPKCTQAHNYYCEF